MNKVQTKDLRWESSKNATCTNWDLDNILCVGGQLGVYVKELCSLGCPDTCSLAPASRYQDPGVCHHIRLRSFSLYYSIFSFHDALTVLKMVCVVMKLVVMVFCLFCF